MKKFYLSVVMFALVFAASACDILITIDGTKKTSYQPGDEIVLLINITHNHKTCQLDIQKTKFDPQGLKILSATEWKATSQNTWQRKMKVKVLKDHTGAVKMLVHRNCTKDDNTGSIIIPVTQVST